MKKMTSRERVLAAARRQPVDRPPLMLWIEPHTLVKIAEEIEKPKQLPDRIFFEAITGLKNLLPDEDLGRIVPLLAFLNSTGFMMQLGGEIVEFPWHNPISFARKIRIENKRPIITDMYGAEHSIMGLYLEITKNPCSTPEELDRYKFPRIDNSMLRYSIGMFRRAHPGMAVSVDIPGVQDVSQWFMGMENLYLWMASNPDVIKRFFKKMLDHTLDLIRDAFKAGADMITILDDYGGQGRMLISKRMWEEFTFPCLRRQCELAHSLGGVVMLHSCGHVQPLLDKFVEAGVDILQSFQPAAGNDFEKAKREFGDRLSFATGIDSQTLAAMTPGEVRESVLGNYRIGSEGGGYILATNHALQVDTPVENLRALFDTLREIAN